MEVTVLSSLGKVTQFHPTLYGARDYLSILGLKLIHVDKRGPCCGFVETNFTHIPKDYLIVYIQVYKMPRSSHGKDFVIYFYEIQLLLAASRKSGLDYGQFCMN